MRARFSNVNIARSGVQVITGGASTVGPGAIWKSTLLSWKPSPETGAAYHQFRSQTFHAGCTSVGSKYEPSPMSFPLMRLMPRAAIESARRSTTVKVESHAPAASVSIPKQRCDQVGSPRPYSTRSPSRTPSCTLPFAYTLVRAR